MEINNLCDELYDFVIESESDDESLQEIKKKETKNQEITRKGQSSLTIPHTIPHTRRAREDNILASSPGKSLRDKVSCLEEKDKWVMSIDVGIINFGISVGIISNDFKIREIVFLELIDISKFVGCSSECNLLYHSKCFADWMEHVFKYHYEFFEECDYILIERQPPCGLKAIEQLIYSRWRDKSYLVSPSSMHKYFEIGHLDYDNRKIRVEKIALEKLKKFPRMIEQYNFYERKHDIADSICLMTYWCWKNNKKYLEEKRREEIDNLIVKRCGVDLSLDEWFNRFRFKPRLQEGILAGFQL